MVEIVTKDTKRKLIIYAPVSLIKRFRKLQAELDCRTYAETLERLVEEMERKLRIRFITP